MLAAIRDAIRVFRGVLGTIIGKTRTSTQSHESRPASKRCGSHWFTIPIPNASSTSYHRATSSAQRDLQSHFRV
jgi:hypothetical protein